MSKVKITAMIKFVESGVDVRAYVNGKPLIGKNGIDEDYHLGQISSSVLWAKNDIVNHFGDVFDNLFSDGWTIEFKVDWNS